MPNRFLRSSSSSRMLAAERNRVVRPQNSGEEQKEQAAGQPREVTM